jgi:saccharopine dehydrogenase-like NADP-dependent oxidoreductase
VSEQIVLLGGYGAVGRAAAAVLADRHPSRVTVAGRNGARAMELARSHPGIVPAEVDVADATAVATVIDGARVVVMCVEQHNAAVAAQCLERGIHYLDISATRTVLAAIERLDPLARSHGATAVLSVGLAPGLTNLLARECLRSVPEATAVALTLCFGLAGDHGADSRRWILDGLGAPVPTAAPARVRLPHFGTRTAHPFPFSDQHTLEHATGRAVTTRLCFDSRVITGTVFALRALHVFAGLRRLGLLRLVDAALANVHVGSDRFVVHAAAADDHGNHAVRAATGRHEAHATGIVTAQVAQLLLDGGTPAGVHHLDDLVDADWLFGRLAGTDLERSCDGEPAP